MIAMGGYVVHHRRLHMDTLNPDTNGSELRSEKANCRPMPLDRLFALSL